jgi:hypothetical protein
MLYHHPVTAVEKVEGGRGIGLKITKRRGSHSLAVVRARIRSPLIGSLATRTSRQTNKTF